MFSTAVLGIIARYQVEVPLISLAAALVSVLLLAVARIGTYKYFTANRNYGYELPSVNTQKRPYVNT